MDIRAREEAQPQASALHMFMAHWTPGDVATEMATEVSSTRSQLHMGCFYRAVVHEMR